jgi:hypothetical protein
MEYGVFYSFFSAAAHRPGPYCGSYDQKERMVFRILQISLFYSGHLLYDDRFYFVEFFGQSGHRGIQLLAQSARSKTDQCAEQSEMGHAHRYSGRRLEKFWF